MIDIKDEIAGGPNEVRFTLEDDDNLLESPNGAQKFEINSPFLLANHKRKTLLDQATPEQLAQIVAANFSRDDDNLLIGTCIDKSDELLELSQDEDGQKITQHKAAEDHWAKYRVIGILGEGSYGKVYKVLKAGNAQSESIALSCYEGSLFQKAPPLTKNRHFASDFLVIKELQTDKMPKKEALQAMNEIEIHGQLSDSPYVVKYIDSFISGTNKVNIVMEYCSGGDLQSMLKARRKNNRPLPELTILRFFLQMCLGIHSFHSKKIIHRDLKAQNIFLTTKMDEVRIGDFGLARQIKKQQDQSSGHSSVLLNDSDQKIISMQPSEELKVQKTQFRIENTCKVGTPFYLAPELIGTDEYGSERQAYTPKSDIWALGIILFELCSLRKPFNGENEEELYKNVREAKPQNIPSISRSLMQLIFNLLHKDPNRRPSTKDIFEMNFIRSQALNLRINLPHRKRQQSAVRFKENFNRLVQKQQTKIKCNYFDISSHSTLAKKNVTALVKLEKRPNLDLESVHKRQEPKLKRINPVKSLLQMNQMSNILPSMSESSDSKVLMKKVLPMRIKSIKKSSSKSDILEKVAACVNPKPPKLKRLKTAKLLAKNDSELQKDSTKMPRSLSLIGLLSRSGRVHKAPSTSKNAILAKVLESPSLHQQQKFKLFQTSSAKILQKPLISNVNTTAFATELPTSKQKCSNYTVLQSIASKSSGTSRNNQTTGNRSLTGGLKIKRQQSGINVSSFEPFSAKTIMTSTLLDALSCYQPELILPRGMKGKKENNIKQYIAQQGKAQACGQIHAGQKKSLIGKLNQLIEQAHHKKTAQTERSSFQKKEGIQATQRNKLTRV